MNVALRVSLVLTFCLSLFQQQKAEAQLLPPNQPEQDACNALQICGNTFTSPYGYQGIGQVSDLTNTPCFGGEANTMWLRLEITSPGILVFTIAPTTTTDDYDMAVVDITNTDCNGVASAPVIRCNFNNNLPMYNNGIIGLNTTSTVQFTTSGFTGNSYLQQITANAGDVYLIMINNFGTGLTGPISGFTIDFSGSTATFNQPPPPKFKQILPYCDLSQKISVQLNTNVFCNSIAADGSDFYLTPSGSIQSVQGINCSGSSGYSNTIKITFNGTLPNGDYTIHAKTGTDGNTLMGLCNSELQLPDSLNFHVGLDPIAALSLDSPACQKISLNLNTPAACASIAPNGSDFLVVGPSNVIVTSATGVGCTAGGFTSKIQLTLSQPIAVDGLYKVRSAIGTDGNTLYDSCGRIMLPQQDYPFVVNSFNGLLQAYPDSVICNLGSTVTLYGVNNGPPPSGGFSYLWTPSNGILYPTALSTPLVVPNMLNYFILQTIDANGCYLRDSAHLKVVPFIGALNPLKTSSCIGDSVQLVAERGVQYNWYSNSALTTVPNDVMDCPTCANPRVAPPLGVSDYYVLITDTRGCRDTLKTEITVNPKPVIEAYPADTTIKYGKTITLYAYGGDFYTWSPTATLSDGFSATPLATPIKPTTYIVTGANEYGCLGYDTVVVNIDFREPVQLPNAFSPNGDNLNDVFKIQNLHFRKLLLFQIYDRWGNKVYDSVNPDQGWDGTYKDKPVNSDVYYYVIKLGYPDNYTETYKGDVTLIR